MRGHGRVRLWMRRRAGPTRLERSARARRERAVAHLARVRRGAGGVPPSLRPRPTRWLAGGVAATSLAAGALLGGPLAAAAARWLGDPSASLTAIHVRGARQLSPGEIAAATGLPRAAPLAAVDADAAATRVAEHPWIAEARAVRLANGRLLLEVVERVPAALALAGEPPRALAVDASGTPFAAAPATLDDALPRLRLREAVEASGTPSPSLAQGLRLAERLAALDLGAPVEIEVPAEDDPEGFAAHVPRLSARLVLGREDFDARLARLVALLDAGLPELESATSVDLRFADQAVLREQPLPKGRAQAAATRGRAAPSETRPSG